MPQQEHRNVGLGSRKLQAAGRYHRDLAGFCNDSRRRSIAHRVFDDGEQHGIVAWLCVDDIGRGEARLF